MKKTLLHELTKLGYSKTSAYAHINGTRRPAYRHMLYLHDNGIVPFSAWVDIKSYLQDNDAKKAHKKVG